MTRFCSYRHVRSIGFDREEPYYEYHGESDHPKAVRSQCMCGHVPFWECEYLCLYRQVFEIEETP